MPAKVKLPLMLTGIVKQEGDQYAALCLELDVASCGETREEAMAALRHAVETYLEYMQDTGREDEILRPVPIEALREFLTEAYEESGEPAEPHAFEAVSLEYAYECIGKIGWRPGFSREIPAEAGPPEHFSIPSYVA